MNDIYPTLTTSATESLKSMLGFQMAFTKQDISHHNAENFPIRVAVQHRATEIFHLGS